MVKRSSSCAFCRVARASPCRATRASRARPSACECSRAPQPRGLRDLLTGAAWATFSLPSMNWRVACSFRGRRLPPPETSSRRGLPLAGVVSVVVRRLHVANGLRRFRPEGARSGAGPRSSWRLGDERARPCGLSRDTTAGSQSGRLGPDRVSSAFHTQATVSFCGIEAAKAAGKYKGRKPTAMKRERIKAPD